MFKKISFFAGSLMLGASLSVYGTSFTDQDIQSIESKVGYQFRNKELLKSAFTHMSWANAKGTTTEFDRLEALGDKVLGLCVMKAGYTESPTAAALSQLLDGKVNGKYLAKCYKNLGLNTFLKVEGGTLESGSRKVYEDSMEALIGAAFRDNSMQMTPAVEALVGKLVLNPVDAVAAVATQGPVAAANRPVEVSESSDAEEVRYSKKELKELRQKAESGDRQAIFDIGMHYKQEGKMQEAVKWLKQMESDVESIIVLLEIRRGYPDYDDRISAVFGRDYYAYCENQLKEKIAACMRSGNEDDKAIGYEWLVSELEKTKKNPLECYQYCRNEDILNYYLREVGKSDADVVAEAKQQLRKLSKLMNIRNSLVTYHLNIDEANRGERVAQKVIADLLLTESVTYQNKTHKQAGMNWLCKWAERGQVSDMLDVAKRFEAGKDVPSSLPEAFKWYLKAANNQNAEAMFKVGEAYEQGKGVGIDFDEAEDWFEKARAKGYSEAVVKFEQLSFRRLEAGANTPAKMVELGKKYEMVRDYAKAFAWYSNAAEAGDKDGCYEFGMMYKHGLGVTSSSNGARIWFEKAKKLGHLKAEKELGSRGW